MKRTLAALALAGVAACGPTLEGTLPTPSPVPNAVESPNTATFRAGAAVVDITPAPGYAMAGHGISGARALGVWTRLKARAIAFEDARGVPLVLVSADLWAVSAGLVDAVAQRVAADPRGRGIARDHLVVAATHTHHGPGQIATNRAANAFTSIDRGFDPELFDFVAGRIAEAVLRAANARGPVRLRRRDVAIPTIARNRSVEAFVENPEAKDVLTSNAGLPGCGPLPSDLTAIANVDRCHAVDPILTTLEVVGSDDAPIAVAAFFAVQPTTMPDRVEVYHGDLFATASARARVKLATTDNPAPVIAWFNGAAGDVSPDWVEQGRADAVRLGYALGEAVAASMLEPGLELNGTIGWSSSQLSIADAKSPVGVTARRAYVGTAALGGPEDARTRFFRRGYTEGQRSSKPRRRGQGRKRPAFGFAAQSLAMPANGFPRTVPLAVVSLGPMVLATVPGEASTVMGRRIAQAVHEARGPSDSVALIGFANEYAGHFTTPQEYDVQHFEGAATLYGPASGRVVAQELARLAAQPSSSAKRSYRYRPGPTLRRSTRDATSWSLEGADPRIRADLDLVAGRAYVTTTFEDARPPWPLGGPDIDATPRVRVTTAGGPLLVDGVPIDDEGDEFALWVHGTQRERWSWTVTWMLPRGAPPQAPLKLELTRVTGDVLCSQPFTLAQVYAGQYALPPTWGPCEAS